MAWEYYVLALADKSWMGGVLDAQETSEKLNALGAAGWELVTGFSTQMGEGKSREYAFVLKRRRGAGIAGPPVQG
ncbi:MAG TPA: DUF4177 domain-containing protein [Phycisphaerae bacterium]|nr:DUF4177 domain-containing protein [Phycisphaerae bacterium]